MPADTTRLDRRRLPSNGNSVTVRDCCWLPISPGRWSRFLRPRKRRPANLFLGGARGSEQRQFLSVAAGPLGDMTDRAALVRLAALIGIDTGYTDALGQTREASYDTLLALIGAFGLPADPEQAASELEERMRAGPLGLGPAHLVHAEAPHPELTLRLPPRTREVAWTCRLEDGEERIGRAAVGTATEGERFALPLPAGLPPGYHRLAVSVGGTSGELDLIVAPGCCHLPPPLAPHASSWGLTCQLHGLRSARDWGMGDFTDLATIAGAAGSCSAVTLGINPLHARFAAEPLHFSPYSPSSRTRLDYLYIDPAVAPGFAEDEAAQALMTGERFGATKWAARSAELIDYSAVAPLPRGRCWRHCGGDFTGSISATMGPPARCSAAAFADFSRTKRNRCSISRFSRRCTNIVAACGKGSRGATGRRRCAIHARPRSRNLQLPGATGSSSFEFSAMAGGSPARRGGPGRT